MQWSSTIEVIWYYLKRIPGINTYEAEEWAREVIGITDMNIISNVFLIQMKLRDGLVDHQRNGRPP